MPSMLRRMRCLSSAASTGSDTTPDCHTRGNSGTHTSSTAGTTA